MLKYRGFRAPPECEIPSAADFFTSSEALPPRIGKKADVLNQVGDNLPAALDSRSEKIIQAELERIAEDRTTLVIAHRLSIAIDADQILVMEGGRIVERGSHRELLARISHQGVSPG